MQSNLLLCELHAHTTWSDGFLTMTELVDLYGRGFDILCVTDHPLRSDIRRFRLRHQTHAHYFATIRRESRRACARLGLHTLCSVDDGLEPAMRAARDAGAAPPRRAAQAARGLKHETSPVRYQLFTSRAPRAGEPVAKIRAMAKVLIVEDDDIIAKGMASHLTAAGFEPYLVANGQTGLARLRFERPDVCVVDLMLPALDGWKLIETARAEGIGTPMVVVSARGSEEDRVHTLDLGADDYLVKPFSMRELVARVRVAARRGVRDQQADRGELIELEELKIDPVSVQAYLDGESAELTPTEFRLLHALAAESPRVVTRDELLQRIWGRRLTRRDRTVDVFVRKLREKIDARAPRHVFLHTRYGVGYKLEPQPK